MIMRVGRSLLRSGWEYGRLWLYEVPCSLALGPDTPASDSCLCSHVLHHTDSRSGTINFRKSLQWGVRLGADTIGHACRSSTSLVGSTSVCYFLLNSTWRIQIPARYVALSQVFWEVVRLQTKTSEK